ncbi:MAG TPA: autotransporter-associated beta strand repeat-containing protein, partial [Erythrobacter sp.]|nr:autotransporter-associated beta strand repeat-containing protein [Erythrobacter sp.]
GNGGIVKTGAGTVFMTGANTYAGGTDIQQGAIRVTDVSVLGTGPITVQQGAALDLLIANAQTLNQAVSGAGILRKSGAGDLTLLSNGLTGGVDIVGGRVIVSTAAALGGGPVTTAVDTQLVFDTAATETISNLISGGGALTKDGAGVLVIQNANTYTGGTIINAGRLGLNNGQGLGTGDVLILQGAQLSLGGVSVANNIGGAGQVVKTANNAGFLTGTNTYSGGTDIQQGQLVVATPASLGTGGVQIANGAALVVDYSGSNAVTLGNVLTGGGSLIKDGTGALVVLGTGNNYVGGTVVSGGSVVVGSAGALGSGNVAVSSGAVVEIGAISFANNVSGAGRIVKTGSGTGALTGTNTHSGGIDIQGGSLEVTGNDALGTGAVTIAAGANLAYTNASAATFSNGLSGAGTFTKLGAGQLTFAGNFTLGALNLTAGRTRINTVATTNATIASGATLDGTGRIIGNLVNNGTVAPGNSIGTLTVQGNYTHNAGSVLEIEFDANGNIDLLDVTGNAVLNGGTIRFVGIGGAEGQGGTFLRTGGTVTGTFDTVETVGAQLPLAVFYTANTGQVAPSVVTARPSTFNAQNLAAADTVLGFIDSIGLADARHGRGNRLWMSGFGAWGSRSASGTTLAYDHETRGISGGINIDVGGNITLGGALGWARGDIELGSNGGGGEQTHTLGSLTARYETGGLTLGAGAVFGGVDQTTLRNVSFNGFAGSVDGETDSSILAFFAEAGVPLGSAGGWTFDLNARGSIVRQEQDAYTESGVSPLRLQLDELATETLEGQARLTAIKRLWDGNVSAEESAAGLDLRLDLGTRYLALSGDRAIPVVFAVSDAGVVLQGDTRDTLQGIGGIALEYTTRSGATFSLGYRGEIGKTDRHAVQAGVSIAF